MLVSRLPVIGKEVADALRHLAEMKNSYEQARISWEVKAPVTGASVAIFYGAGFVFAISAGALLLREM